MELIKFPTLNGTVMSCDIFEILAPTPRPTGRKFASCSDGPDWSDRRQFPSIFSQERRRTTIMNAAAHMLGGNDTEVSPIVIPVRPDSSDTIESNDIAEGTSEQENHKGPSLHQPMLQYTTRLRDILISRRYEIEPSSMYHLCEAEFKRVDSQASPHEQNAVPQRPVRKRKSTDEPLAADDESSTTSIVFPQAFHFHLFWRGFNRSKHLQFHIYPRGTGMHPPVQDRHTLSIQGKPVDWFGQKVSLIWLTPSIFISTIRMSWTSAKTGKNAPLWMYTITLEMRHGRGTCSFHIYCIEYFQKYKRSKPSSPRLPLTFFRQVLQPLPVDFFASIEFTRQAAIDCECFYSQFLSCILPCAEDVCPPREVKNYQEYTEVRFADKINDLELNVILNHQFHPYVRLAFGNFDETSLDPVVFNFMLRHASSHVRHLKVPKSLIQFLPSEYGGESFTANPRLETLTIDWTNLQSSLLYSYRDYWNNTSVSPDLLKGIQRNPNFQRLNLRFDAPIYSIRDTREQYFINASVLHLMKRVIPSHPSFKELTVEAKLNAMDVPRSNNGETIDFLVLSTNPFPNGLVSSPNSFLNGLSHLSFQFMGQSAAEDRKLQVSSTLWDSHVIPHLAINWLFHQSRAEQRHEAPAWAFSKKATQHINRRGLQPAASLLALQIRAINEGILYRKTTEHIPRDTSTTNASAIAGLLRLAIGELVPVS
jgi:hypothetical protein